jgi:hypothetical protein
VTRPFDRRTLISTLVLGVALLGPARGADRPTDKPCGDLLETARQRMKQEVKPGVVIIVPEEESAQNYLALRLTRLLGGEGPMEEQPIRTVAYTRPAPVTPSPAYLFCQAVFVCLPAKQARQAFPGLKPSAELVLLDLNGKPVASLPGSPALFEENFVPAITELLHGERGERLTTLADAQRRALGPLAARIDQAIKDLDHDRFRKREAASELLARTADRTTAILIQAHRRAPSLEARRRIERLLDAVVEASSDGTVPIHGMAWQSPPRPEGQAGFNVNNPPGGPPRRFLRFVTDKP